MYNIEMSDRSRIIILWFAVFLSVTPFLLLFNYPEYFSSRIALTANIFGLIGVLMLWWQTVLGFRQISTKISKDYIGVTRLHIALGIYGSIFVFLHPILEMLAVNESLSYLFLPSFATELAEHTTFGRAAFLLFILLWITSAVLRKRINYRPWKYIHYVSYAIMIFVFVHAIEIGTFLQSFSAVRFYWFFIVSTYSLLLVWKVFDLLGLGKPRFILKSKKEYENDVFVYEFSPIGRGISNIRPGQFVYVKNKILGEAHPFSVMRFNENGDLIFGIKKVGPYTENLSKLDIGDRVFIEGPYGVFTKEGHNNDKKVVFAGGIGITPFVELVNRYGHENTFFFNANRKMKSNEIVLDLKQKLGDRYVDVIAEDESVAENISIIKGRMTKEVISSRVPKDYIEEGKYFICGPQKFMEAITQNLIDLGVGRDRIFMEEFSL